MKFEVAKGDLLEALQMASSAIPSKTTLQILNNFHFRLQGNELQLTATDLDLTVLVRLEVQGHQDGALVLNAKKFLEVVRELPDRPIICTVDDFIMTLKSESGFQCNLAGFDPTEYPEIPTDEVRGQVAISAKDLGFLFAKTHFAVSTDFTTRVALTGLYLEHKGDQLIMVGTDGHRFGKAWIDAAGKSLPEGMILPPRTIQQVLKACAGGDEQVDVTIAASLVTFKHKNITVISKLIQGPYPDYERVVPQELSKAVVASREELMSVLRRVSTMAHSKTKQVKFTFQEGSLVLSARNQDIGGDSEETMPIEYMGKTFSMGFNGSFFLEVLRLMDTEQVKIRLNSNLGATVIEPLAESFQYFIIVMPLRLLDEE